MLPGHSLSSSACQHGPCPGAARLVTLVRVPSTSSRHLVRLPAREPAYSGANALVPL